MEIDHFSAKNGYQTNHIPLGTQRRCRIKITERENIHNALEKKAKYSLVQYVPSNLQTL